MEDQDREKIVDTSKPLPGNYDPKVVETGKYSRWERKGLFKPEYRANQCGDEGEDQRDSTVMTITPPNMTGILHVGHALTVTVQDSFTRWHRMMGKKTLWVPGLDHAGVAARMVAERQLSSEQRKKGHQLDSDEVLERIKENMDKLSTKITNQLKMLGASYDWDRYTFTLDQIPSKAVTEAFCQLYSKGRIYNDDRLVLWSPCLRTALSDAQIEQREIYPGEKIIPPGCDRLIPFGEEISFAYKIIDPNPDCQVEEVVVTTTRIEWMLGHTAVVIHSSHKDCHALKEKMLRHPFSDRKLPVIVNESFINHRKNRTSVWKPVVRREKEALFPVDEIGAQGVIPAHDLLSFELWKKHNNEPRGVQPRFGSVQVFTDEGNVTDQCGNSFMQKNRFEVREQILDELRSKQLLRGRKGVQLTVEVCRESHDIIELQKKRQWYIDTNGSVQKTFLEDDTLSSTIKDRRDSREVPVSPEGEMHSRRDDTALRSPRNDSMAENAIKAINEGLKNETLQITPDRFVTDCKTALLNAEPWCISRQGKWGHEIPVYEATGERPNMDSVWVAGISRSDARAEAAKKLGIEKDKVRLTQEQGVLDSWFSCALLPFSIFGWPEKTPDLLSFYPGTILETGDDVFTLWVARAITMAVELTGELPTKEIYLHSMVKDMTGKKMGRSSGVVIDPCDLINGISGEDLMRKISQTYWNNNDLKKAFEEKKNYYNDGFQAYGADSLRLLLISYVEPDQPIRFEISDVAKCKDFCDGIWKAFREALSLFEKCQCQSGLALDQSPDNIHDCWIRYLLNITIDEMKKQFENFDFKEAVRKVKELWTDIQQYITHLASKIDNPQPSRSDQLRVRNLYTCLDLSLRLLHPFMPFITEELFHRLPGRIKEEDSICVEGYPGAREIVHIPEELTKLFIFLNKCLRDIGRTDKQLEVILPYSENNQDLAIEDIKKIIQIRCQPKDIKISWAANCSETARYSIFSLTEVK